MSLTAMGSSNLHNCSHFTCILFCKHFHSLVDNIYVINEEIHIVTYINLGQGKSLLYFWKPLQRIDNIQRAILHLTGW